MRAVPGFHQFLHFAALLVFARAAEVLGGELIALNLRPLEVLRLAHVDERADDGVLVVVGKEHGRHRLQAPAVEHVEKQRGDDVVHLVPERDLRAAELSRDAIENAAAQAGAERADVLSRGNELFDDGVGVLIFDVVGHAGGGEVALHDRGGAARDVLVDVHGDEVKVHGGAGLQLAQDFKEHVAVLAAAHGDRDLVAFANHLIVGDRLRGEAHDALFQLFDGHRGVHVVTVRALNGLFVVVAAFCHAAVLEPVDRRFDCCCHGKFEK